jgi:exodeoxyribonuclease-3
VRLVTWNVNSLKARLGRVETWIGANAPDIVCLQETKLADAAFPTSAFADLGYESAHHGDGRWNGVAIISRIGLAGVRRGFFDDAPGDGTECRILSADCGGHRVVTVYVPNGRIVGSEFFAAKLVWLNRLRRELDETLAPGASVAVCGDFNVAPTDDDVWDIGAFDGATHVTPAERRALDDVRGWGLHDVVREQIPEGPGPFSWWDYRAGSFHKGHGMRIDLLLCSPSLAATATAAYVDRNERKKGASTEAPSDHAPVVVDFALASNESREI